MDKTNSNPYTQSQLLQKVVEYVGGYLVVVTSFLPLLSFFASGNNTEFSRLSICSQLVDPGPCSESMQRWHFSPEKGNCLAFVYTGCAGNRNRFKGYEVCMGYCEPARRKFEEEQQVAGGGGGGGGDGGGGGGGHDRCKVREGGGSEEQRVVHNACMCKNKL